MTPQKIKEELLNYCVQYIETRKNKILKSIAGIEEALFDEGKSTAGDKHHTGRAMLQIDREHTGKQLLEIEKLEQILPKIEIEIPSKTVRLGSVVSTKKAHYFLSISAGLFSIDGVDYYCVSKEAPVGAILMGKQAGEEYFFRGENHLIKQLY